LDFFQKSVNEGRPGSPGSSITSRCPVGFAVSWIGFTVCAVSTLRLFQIRCCSRLQVTLDYDINQR
jgi:hypothetical protein